jgi:hypothetical protein
MNVQKAGAGIPVNFGVGGDAGLGIIDSAVSRQVDCFTGSPISAEVTISLSGNSRLVYFETTGLYRFVWKTSKSWAMQCRELIVTLDDGTVHRALFTFTR